MNPAGRDREPHRGLRIEMAIGLVVVGCGLGGLVLATVLAFAWGNVERKTLKISDRSAAVSDLRRLDAELDNWALNVDLVLGGSVGSSLLDTDATASLLRDLLGRIEWDAIQTLRGDLAQYIDDEVDRLHEAVQLFGQDRDSHLPRLLAKSDAEFGPIIERFKKIDLEIQQFILGEEAELAASRSTLRLVSWVATIMYLLFIAVLWRWASRSITHSRTNDIACQENRAIRIDTSLESESSRRAVHWQRVRDSAPTAPTTSSADPASSPHRDWSASYLTTPRRRHVVY